MLSTTFKGILLQSVGFEDRPQHMLSATVVLNPGGGIFDRVEEYAEDLVRIEISLPPKPEQATTRGPCTSLIHPEFVP